VSIKIKIVYTNNFEYKDHLFIVILIYIIYFINSITECTFLFHVQYLYHYGLIATVMKKYKTDNIIIPERKALYCEDK